MISIRQIEPRFAAALEKLQHDCFPTLDKDELMQEKHFLNHCKLFPEGNFVAFDELSQRVVGLGSGFLLDFDFDHPDHTFQEIISEGYYSNHSASGDWYYGADISVHPEYRGQGIGRRLYDARKQTVKTLNRRGIVAGGLIPDFAKHKTHLSAQSYVDKVLAGELSDTTLSMQLRNGFEVRGLLENYIEDSASDGWSTLIVWDNPDFRHA